MPQDKSVGRWIPLESNPELFNSWSEKAGLVTSQAHFVDVYGFDEELLAMVPKPVKAVILLFPIDAASEARRQEEDQQIAKEGQPKLEDTIFFVKQTIGNACGTIGLIHALANAGITFTPMSALQAFIRECEDKTPLERAQVLATTSLFASIHAETAQAGQTQTNDDTNLHFTCFVEAPDADIRELAEGKTPNPAAANDRTSTGMRLIELDGRRACPIDRGECKDLLADATSFIKSHYIATSTSLEFSLMALTAGKDFD
ncbi:cysteine proteinase [Pholiota conissans]|uniref:Ubiquitin carboxyl-terminal hydrolase n=1 Tax=Pholiota conissans TaxID=109636 RepID=A0A9P5YVR1_9AGAR|nr:cysteine proteinase [Pholiota conissans]